MGIDTRFGVAHLCTDATSVREPGPRQKLGLTMA